MNFNRKSYSIAQSLKEAVNEEIRKILEDNNIEYNNSPCTNPVVAIQKKSNVTR